MKTDYCLPSTCRYCRYYTPQGRRGGNCQKLCVPVQAAWKACPLANSAFMSPWERWAEMVVSPLTVQSPEVSRAEAGVRASID